MELNASERPSCRQRMEAWNSAQTATAPLREISFPRDEGYLWQIRAGLKLGTLHRDREAYHLRPGEIFLFRCDAEDRPSFCRCVGIEHTPMELVDPVLLAVDGFLSKSEAFNRMKLFYDRPETPFSWKTSMVYVAFMEHGRFQGLPEQEKEILVLNDPSVSFRRPELRHIVFPSIAKWAAAQGSTGGSWLEWLRANRLISEEEARTGAKLRLGRHTLRTLPHEEFSRVVAHEWDPRYIKLVSLGQRTDPLR